jgi:hypothetical protein
MEMQTKKSEPTTPAQGPSEYPRILGTIPARPPVRSKVQAATPFGNAWRLVLMSPGRLALEENIGVDAMGAPLWMRRDNTNSSTDQHSSIVVLMDLAGRLLYNGLGGGAQTLYKLAEALALVKFKLTQPERFKLEEYVPNELLPLLDQLMAGAREHACMLEMMAHNAGQRSDMAMALNLLIKDQVGPNPDPEVAALLEQMRTGKLDAGMPTESAKLAIQDTTLAGWDGSQPVVS